jgi:type I restriction enzyme, S subunit
MDVALKIAGDADAAAGPWAIPNGWSWTPLGQLGTWLGGGTPSKANAAFWSNGTVPWVSPKDMKVAVIGETEDKVTSAAVEGSSAKYVPEGSVLMVMRSGILKHSFPVAITDRIVTLNQDLRALTPHVGISPNYIARYLALAANRVLEECSKDGTTVDSIEVAALERLRVPLAPLAEQRRIVARVDALFAETAEGEAALAAARKGLDTFRHALLKAAVTGELTKDWRAENPVIESGRDLLVRIAKGRPTKGQRRRKISTQPFDISLHPALPQGWAWARPSEIQADIDNALTIGPFGSNLKVSDYRESGVPLIFVRHIRSEDFRGGNPKFVTEQKARELASHIARAGDILITKMGDPPGDACRYPDDAPDAIITADCIKWTIHDHVCFPNFYVHFINSAAGRSQILEKTTGVAQQKVSLDRFRQIFVPVPPPAEAAEILRRVSDALAASADVLAMFDAEAADAARLRQSILKAAFEGRLVPQDPADEPATALLARLGVNPPAMRAGRGRARKSVA